MSSFQGQDVYEDQAFADPAMQRAQQVASEAEAYEMNTAASRSQAILDGKHTISKVIFHEFEWRGPSLDKSGNEVPAKEPQPFTLDHDAIAKIFGDKVAKAGAVEPVFVHSMVLEEKHNSAPYAVALKIGGVEGKELLGSHYRASGDSVSLVIPHGTSTQHETLYEMPKDIDADMLREHGNASIKSEMEAMIPTPNGHVLILPQSRAGRIMKHREDEIFSDSPYAMSLEPIDEINMYMVPKAKALKILDEYDDKVISKMPKTDLTKYQATLTRFDRSPKTAKKKAFGDASDAPGLASRTAIENTSKARQFAYAKIRISIIDPSVLAKQ